MANIVVIGVEGQSDVYVVDLDAKTVETLAAPAASALGKADELRNAGASVIRGVNLAVKVSSAPAASGGHFDG